MSAENNNADSCRCPEEDEHLFGCGCEGFGDLLKFTIPGYILAFLTGGILDYYGFQQSGVGQWIVRTFAGEGESILEGIYSMRQRIRRAAGTLAEAYGWGKLLGMFVPWIVDWGSRWLGIDVYSVESFYIPFFYAMSDQMGANISGALFLRKKQGTWGKAFKVYFKNPVMITSLSVILFVPMGLLVVRIFGFSPTTQKYTALETIAANLCWLPVLVGWYSEKQKNKKKKRNTL